MPIATDRLVFLHIPKTGGFWIKQAMITAGLQPYDVGQQHDHFPLILNYETRKFYEDRFVFTFVRHPVTWYQSRWSFRILSGWQARHPLDWKCATNDFQEFVGLALAMKDTGWCTWLFNNYTDNEPDLINFVGRFENLADDFINVMRQAGYDVDEEKIRNIPPINAGDLDGKKSSYWAKYSEQLLERVIEADQTIINKYYEDYKINPKTLCGPSPY